MRGNSKRYRYICYFFLTNNYFKFIRRVAASYAFVDQSLVLSSVFEKLSVQASLAQRSTAAFIIGLPIYLLYGLMKL